MATQISPIQVDVDRRLIDHRDHLPETVECRCGYRRADPTPAQPARTLSE